MATHCEVQNLKSYSKKSLNKKAATRKTHPENEGGIWYEIYYNTSSKILVFQQNCDTQTIGNYAIYTAE